MGWEVRKRSIQCIIREEFEVVSVASRSFLDFCEFLESCKFVLRKGTYSSSVDRNELSGSILTGGASYVSWLYAFGSRH